MSTNIELGLIPSNIPSVPKYTCVTSFGNPTIVIIKLLLNATSFGFEHQLAPKSIRF